MVSERVREFGRQVLRIVLRDPLSTVLLFGSILLTILFFSLLDSIGPESPGARPRSARSSSWPRRTRSRPPRCSTRTRASWWPPRGARQLWAAYPSSDAQTNNLLRTLGRGGAIVDVKQQPWKPERRIVVQFLMPILILVCLFAFFMRLGQDAGPAASPRSRSSATAARSARRARAR